MLSNRLDLVIVSSKIFLSNRKYNKRRVEMKALLKTEKGLNGVRAVGD